MVGDTEGLRRSEPAQRAPLGRPGLSWRGDGALGGAMQRVEVQPSARATPVGVGLEPGPLLLRMLAFVLDYVLLFVLLAIAWTILAEFAGIDSELPRDQMERALEPLAGPLYAVTFAVYLAFHTVCNTLGATPGKRICGLRIVDASGRAPGLWRGLQRALWSLASGMPPWLGYLAVTWSRERRAWHDQLSGTWVVRAPRQ